jgi:alpha-amylase
VEKKPIQSSYFVTNHDTDEIYNKHYGAYILTHEGYPNPYQDYEEWLNKSKWTTYLIHNNKATGTSSFYMTTTSIARRNGYNGNPGLVVYINNSPPG